MFILQLHIREEYLKDGHHSQYAEKRKREGRMTESIGPAYVMILLCNAEIVVWWNCRVRAREINI